MLYLAVDSDAVGGPDAKHLLSLVAGARYAQRCPVDFGVAMEAMITA